MLAKWLSTIVLLVALVGISAGFVGCGQNPIVCKVDCDGTDPVVFPPRHTPNQAIEYLRLGWEKKDSTRADTVFAGDYQGTSTDQTDPSPTTFFYAKSDEVHAIGALQQPQFEVRDVTLDFKDSTLWVSEIRPGDPTGWVTITIDNNPSVIVQIGSDVYRAERTESFEFKVKPVTNGSQTLWQIVRWQEVLQ